MKAEDRRREKRMADFDAMPVEDRRLVNEYGLNRVRCVQSLGITRETDIARVLEAARLHGIGLDEISHGFCQKALGERS